MDHWQLFAILLIIRNTERIPDKNSADKTSNAIDQSQAAASKDPIVEEPIEKELPAISFLRLEEEEIEALPKGMALFYDQITTKQNLASGISIFPCMKALNSYINEEFKQHDIKPFEKEDELFSEMEGLKVNPRVTAQHYNRSGRMILKKMSILQEKAYPKLANQLREVKSALSEAPSNGKLEGHGSKVKEFFDECFVFFYLAWEEEENLPSN